MSGVRLPALTDSRDHYYGFDRPLVMYSLNLLAESGRHSSTITKNKSCIAKLKKNRAAGVRVRNGGRIHKADTRGAELNHVRMSERNYSSDQEHLLNNAVSSTPSYALHLRRFDVAIDKAHNIAHEQVVTVGRKQATLRHGRIGKAAAARRPVDQYASSGASEPVVRLVVALIRSGIR